MQSGTGLSFNESASAWKAAQRLPNQQARMDSVIPVATIETMPVEVRRMGQKWASVCSVTTFDAMKEQLCIACQ